MEEGTCPDQLPCLQLSQGKRHIDFELQTVCHMRDQFVNILPPGAQESEFNCMPVDCQLGARLRDGFGVGAAKAVLGRWSEWREWENDGISGLCTRKRHATSCRTCKGTSD